MMVIVTVTGQTDVYENSQKEFRITALLFENQGWIIYSIRLNNTQDLVVLIPLSASATLNLLYKNNGNLFCIFERNYLSVGAKS